MEETKVIKFLESKREFLFGKEAFDAKMIEKMLTVSDKYLPLLQHLPLRNPSTAKLIAMVPGILGIDSFYFGNIKRGIIKYFTFGGLGILWFKDLKNAEKICRKYNRNIFMKALQDPRYGLKLIEKNATAKKAFAVAKGVAPELLKGAKNVQNTMYIK